MSIAQLFKNNGTLYKKKKTTITFGKMPLLLNTMTIFQLTNQENRHTTLMSGHASAHRQNFKMVKSSMQQPNSEF